MIKVISGYRAFLLITIAGIRYLNPVGRRIGYIQVLVPTTGLYVTAIVKIHKISDALVYIAA